MTSPAVSYHGYRFPPEIISHAVWLYLVGSGTGAVIRRWLLGRVGGFPLRARVGGTVIPFPAPAASHAACGFAALRAPAPLRGKGYGAVRVGRGGRASVSGQRGTPRRVRG